jgi:hypothetical protein
MDSHGHAFGSKRNGKRGCNHQHATASSSHLAAAAAVRAK